MCQQHRGVTSVWGMVSGEVFREGFQGGDHEMDLEEAQGSMQAGGRPERPRQTEGTRLGCERHHRDIYVGARMGMCVSETVRRDREEEEKERREKVKIQV